jgi:TIR domain-containing protein
MEYSSGAVFHLSDSGWGAVNRNARLFSFLNLGQLAGFWNRFDYSVPRPARASLGTDTHCRALADQPVTSARLVWSGFCRHRAGERLYATYRETVFISYRRTNFPWALSVFQNLTQHGYDVFIDFTGIASGDFERVILESIKARAHFLVLLTPSALERCVEPADWLRREIETAFATRRNIVPLMLEGFDFGTPAS